MLSTDVSTVISHHQVLQIVLWRLLCLLFSSNVGCEASLHIRVCRGAACLLSRCVFRPRVSIMCNRMLQYNIIRIVFYTLFRLILCFIGLTILRS
jgi:hypothetical protein